MRLWLLILTFFLSTTFSLYTIRSINPETDSATSIDWAGFSDLSAAPADQGDPKIFSFDARTDLITQGLPESEGNPFSISTPENQGSLISTFNTNPAVLESSQTASDGPGPPLTSLDDPSVVPEKDSIVSEDKGVPFVTSNIASNAPETVVVAPQNQERPGGSSIITPSTPETGVSDSGGQDDLYPSSITALSISDSKATVSGGQIAPTTPDVQNSQIPSDNVPCNSDQHTGDKELLFCPANSDDADEDGDEDGDGDEGRKYKPGRHPPVLDRPENLIEPDQDRVSGPGEEKYPKPNPWIIGPFRKKKKCNDGKHTLCCDGPLRMPQWVSHCYECTISGPPPTRRNLSLTDFLL